MIAFSERPYGSLNFSKEEKNYKNSPRYQYPVLPAVLQFLCELVPEMREVGQPAGVQQPRRRQRHAPHQTALRRRLHVAAQPRVLQYRVKGWVVCFAVRRCQLAGTLFVGTEESLVIN